MVQSSPPFRERRRPLSVPSKRWVESVGSTVTAMAPLTMRPGLAGSHVAPSSRERKRPPYALGSCPVAAPGVRARTSAGSVAIVVSVAKPRIAATRPQRVTEGRRRP